MAVMKELNCTHCGKLFMQTHFNQRVCSDECRAAARKISVDKSNAKMKANNIQKRCIVCRTRFRTNRSDVVACSPYCQRVRTQQLQKEYHRIRREEAKRKEAARPATLAEFNAAARAAGMTYGQYELYLRKEEQKRNAV